MSNSFDLQRFVDAPAAIYPRVVEELLRDENRHTECSSFCRKSPVSASVPWLNASLGSRAEAVAHLEYGLLGPRLIECTRLVTVSEKTITDILGSPDDMKFRSCSAVRRRLEAAIFAQAIAAFYPDEKDRATLEILETSRSL